jgi:hypothetical protein
MGFASCTGALIMEGRGAADDWPREGAAPADRVRGEQPASAGGPRGANEPQRLVRQPGAVRYVDEHGNEWRVFETRLSSGEPCLLFESSFAFRRVRRFPPNWRQLSSEELRRLSWGR